jgi:hypothetical protein
MGARLCKDVPAQLLPIAAQAATPIGAAPVKHAQAHSDVTIPQQ